MTRIHKQNLDVLRNVLAKQLGLVFHTDEFNKSGLLLQPRFVERDFITRKVTAKYEVENPQLLRRSWVNVNKHNWLYSWPKCLVQFPHLMDLLLQLLVDIRMCFCHVDLYNRLKCLRSYNQFLGANSRDLFNHSPPENYILLTAIRTALSVHKSHFIQSASQSVSTRFHFSSD